MMPVIHIGPPKTATSSIQEAVLPRLGRPVSIKPDWTGALARHAEFNPPKNLEAGIIVSDERLGDFARFSPQIIADRLAQVFQSARIIYTVREPLKLFYSSYRQRLLNAVTLQRVIVNKWGTPLPPRTASEFFDEQLAQYHAAQSGFFASTNLNLIRTSFLRYFEFTTLNFELLPEDASAFAKAFALACESSHSPPFWLVNETTPDRIRQGLSEAPRELSDFERYLFLDFYESPRLTPDREDFLRNWGDNKNLKLFSLAFKFWKRTGQ